MRPHRYELRNAVVGRPTKQVGASAEGKAVDRTGHLLNSLPPCQGQEAVHSSCNAENQREKPKGIDDLNKFCRTKG